jgi:SAM-dependent methyltransferase
VTDWDDAAYGEGFADVYDDWYGDVTDTAATVAKVVSLAEGHRVLELGVGTGRLALAMSAAGLVVSGVDVSPAMVERLRAKPGGSDIEITIGDMVDDAPAGPFGVALAAYNTLFNLPSRERQCDCFQAVSQRLRPGGFFVVEGAVLDEGTSGRGSVDVKAIEVDRVVLSVTLQDVASRTARGQFLELSADGIRMRPWRIRWSTAAELDDMAAAAGLTLVERSEDWSGAPFGPSSDTAISVYRQSRG